MTHTDFQYSWSRRLFEEYMKFLRESVVSDETFRRHAGKAKKIFLMADQHFIKAEDITLEWVESIVDSFLDPRGIKKSLLIFLEKKELISRPSSDDLFVEATQRALDRCPKEFRRLLQIYCNEKMELRKRQIKNYAKKPLSLRTILTNVEIYNKFVKWLRDNVPEIDTWEKLQEQEVNLFLLTLSNKNREIVRKDLQVLFKLAKRKRLIAHIPILDKPSRELPATVEALSFEKQAKVAEIIQRSLYTEPLPSLLSALCFFHGLSNENIRNIQIVHLDIDGKRILFKDRPPAFLNDLEILLLTEYLKIRSQIINAKSKRYLFISSSTSERFEDKPVSNRFVWKKVEGLTGYSPKVLRITCFNSMAALFGPQMLIDAFGLSLTQSSRYGKFEEFLLEEEIRFQLQR